MKIERTYKHLYNYLRWNQINNVKKILDNQPNLDITYKDGLYFRLAIKNKNLAMLNSILDYYKKTCLKGDETTTQYQIAKYKLEDILEDALKRFDTSKEIEKTLSNYISSNDDELDSNQDFNEESDDDSQDLGSDYEELSFDFSNHETNNYSEESALTEANLEKHNKLMGDNSSGIDVY